MPLSLKTPIVEGGSLRSKLRPTPRAHAGWCRALEDNRTPISIVRSACAPVMSEATEMSAASALLGRTDWGAMSLNEMCVTARAAPLGGSSSHGEAALLAGCACFGVASRPRMARVPSTAARRRSERPNAVNVLRVVCCRRVGSDSRRSQVRRDRLRPVPLAADRGGRSGHDGRRARGRAPHVPLALLGAQASSGWWSSRRRWHGRSQTPCRGMSLEI